MKISLNWLKQYIDFNFTPEEIAHELTMAGLEVEEIHKPDSADFSGIIIADILSVDRHPDADKLSVCQVYTGSEEIQVVCGAPNVATGQKVPFAPVGASLSGSQITSVKLRGVQSEGMICSERELGLSENHDGIMVLNDSSLKAGTPYDPPAVSDDIMLEIDLTPNRPDCLSHIGVAREIGAILEKNILLPEIKINESDVMTDDYISISIQDPDSCPRYSARYISGITVKESPDWLKSRLQSIGIRPINNIVDVTNFVLMETGHPLHAFDYSTIQGGKIEVRKAKTGEKFTTLDSVERILDQDDLLICDGEKPVALAGIMGGENSEVTAETKDILLESAYFDPMTVRKTAKRLGMFTEASQRFERGADPNNTVYAANRAAQLIAELGGGKIAQHITDCNAKPIEPLQVTLRLSRLSHILGVDIPGERVVTILNNLELKTEGGDPLTVTVPTFRPDITREIDLIEEVLRHFGYNNVPSSGSITIPLADNRNMLQEYIEMLKDTVSGMGLLEALNSSLVPEKFIQLYEIQGEAIGVTNPLNPDTAFLRTSLLPGLLSSLQWNLNRSAENVRLFEIGKTFISHSKEKLPDERTALSGIAYGNINTSPFWAVNDGNMSFFHLKGLVQEILKRSQVKDYTLTGAKHSLFSTVTGIICNDQNIGFFGEISREIRNEWGINNPVFAFELNIEQMLTHRTGITHTPISRYPMVKRDMAFLVNNSVTAESIQNCIIEFGGDFLSRVDLFDVYQGERIPDNKKSMAFSLVFMSEERTLNDKDIDPAVSNVIENVCKSLDAELRS